MYRSGMFCCIGMSLYLVLGVILFVEILKLNLFNLLVRLLPDDVLMDLNILRDRAYIE